MYSASEDGTLRLWDFATGDCLRTYELGQPIEHMVRHAAAPGCPRRGRRPTRDCLQRPAGLPGCACPCATQPAAHAPEPAPRLACSAAWCTLPDSHPGPACAPRPRMPQVLSPCASAAYVSLPHRLAASKLLSLQLPSGAPAPSGVRPRGPLRGVAASPSGRLLAAPDRYSLWVWAAGGDGGRRPANFHHVRPYTVRGARARARTLAPPAAPLLPG